MRSHERGPFTLYEEDRCQLRITVDIDREAVKLGDSEHVERALSGAVERFASREEAQASPAWNRRERDPYPESYEDTRRRADRWWNGRIEARFAAALETVDRIAAEPLPPTIGDDRAASYLQAFVDGAIHGQMLLDPPDCDHLVTADFDEALAVATAEEKAHEDGKQLALALEMLGRLPDCTVAETKQENDHAE